VHRIDTAGHVNGRFSNGNPQIGQRATVLGADWPNSVQEELATVIEQAGLALDKAANDQLYLAIVELIQNNAGGGGGGGGDAIVDVPITREVSTSGLAKGGGTLAADLDISVDAASAAQVVAGTAADVAITPAALAAAAGPVFGTTGYIRLPGGLIVQWGVATAAANSTTVVTLPTTFPIACAFAGCEGGTSDTVAEDNNPHVSGRGQGSISIYSARNAAVFVNFIAFGF